MKMDEYKKTLDDVKCSDDFRNKMEKLLSQPAQQTQSSLLRAETGANSRL